MIRKRIISQYANVFDFENTLPYIHEMSEIMRKILIKMMDIHGHSEHDLEKLSGVSQPTINRFINRKHESLSPRSAAKIAPVYGLNESQLRGHMPIPDFSIEEDPHTIRRNHASYSIDTSSVETTHEKYESSPQQMPLILSEMERMSITLKIIGRLDLMSDKDLTYLDNYTNKRCKRKN